MQLKTIFYINLFWLFLDERIVRWIRIRISRIVECLPYLNQKLEWKNIQLKNGNQKTKARNRSNSYNIFFRIYILIIKNLKKFLFILFITNIVLIYLQFYYFNIHSNISNIKIDLINLNSKTKYA